MESSVAVPIHEESLHDSGSEVHPVAHSEAGSKSTGMEIVPSVGGHEGESLFASTSPSR